MLKLTVVAGPNRGTTYAVQEGEISIGRQVGNVIVLESARVSKQHCKLVVNGEAVRLEDAGSANGTFVNGELAKVRELRPGDRISVGDYVLELSQGSRKKKKPRPLVELAQVVNFPSARGGQFPMPSPHPHPQPGQYPAMPGGAGGFPGAAMPGMPAPGGHGGPAGAFDLAPSGPPSDLRGKIIWYFEHRFMPVFYSLNARYEWRMIAAAMVAGMILLNIFLAVDPIFTQGRERAMRELKIRASLIARQIRDRNVQALEARQEGKADVGTLGRETNVRVALVVDLDGRILAPAERMNDQVLTAPEGFAIKAAAARLRQGREFPFYTPVGENAVELEGEVVIAIWPIKGYNSKTGQSQTLAMAVASIEGRYSTPDAGELGVAYSNAMILNGIAAILVLLILYKLTLRPLQRLNDDIDKGLRGEATEVSREYRFAELGPLMDSINSALSRAAAGGAGAGIGGVATTPAQQAEEYAGPLKGLAEMLDAGLMILDADRRIAHINPKLEEASGIRSDSATGQEVPMVARDQAFIALCADLFGRVSPGSAPASDDFDFSGVSFKVTALAFGPDAGSPKAYVLWVRSNG